MSSSSSSTGNRLAAKAKAIAQEDIAQASTLISKAAKSSAYTYPIKGIYYFLRHKELSKPLRTQLAPIITTGISVTSALFLFTYLPQVAVLTLFNGPLAVISTVFLVLSESATVTNLVSRGFFIEDALVDTFDGTLLIRDQSRLVSEGRTVKPRGSASDTIGRLGKLAKKPFARFTPTAIIRYLMYLPLNFIPVVGPVLFILFQARKFGPNAHARYFQLKGLNQREKEEYVHARKAEYTAFGIPAMLLEMIPFVGVFFTFTNQVGAALWAADIEKSGVKSGKASAPSSEPPAYDDHEF